MLRRSHSVRQRLSRLLDSEEFLSSNGSNLMPSKRPYFSYPTANVERNEKYVDLEIAVPGFKKEELQVSIANHILTIKGEKSEDQVRNDSDLILIEHDLASFERSFELTEITDENQIMANYADGMLRIRLCSKKDETSNEEVSREIEIQ